MVYRYSKYIHQKQDNSLFKYLLTVNTYSQVINMPAVEG